MGFNSDSSDWTRPAQDGFSITAGPSALAHHTRGINVATDGNVTFTLYPSGTSLQLYLVAGVIHPISASHVTAASATGIVGLY
jgi:hypothetical protein